MKRIASLAVVVAVLWAAAIVAWVDAWPTVMRRDSAPAPAQYVPPRVEVADGVKGIDQAEVAAFVQQVVNDSRGWRTDLDQFTLRIVPPGYRGTNGINHLIGQSWAAERLAVVTADAWVRVGPKFAAVGGTLDEQRTWVVLHELGHLLGHDHENCPGSGPAPIMRTATYEIGTCSRNAWVNPSP